MENIAKLMAVFTKVYFAIICSTLRVCLAGSMAEVTTETGRTARCKDMECFDGLMGIDTKENTNMGKNKGMANFTGGMEESTMESGIMD